MDTYLDSNYSGAVKIMNTEYDYRSIESMVADKNIPGLRIGLFEQPEDVLVRVGANSAYDVNQAYLLQLFFVVARIGDYDTVVEHELLDIKDHIDDWSYNINAGSVTTNELLTFEWDSIGRIERRDKYSLLEINFGAYRQRRL